MVQFLGGTTSKNKHHLGSKTQLLYWGVPRNNFAGVPPAHWGDCLMSPEQLAMFEPIGGQQVNYNDYFVVDQDIPWNGLGCHVVQYVFYANTNFTRSPTTNGNAITATGTEPAVSGSVHPAIGGPDLLLTY